MLKTLFSTQKGLFNTNNVHKLNSVKFFCTTVKPVEPPASFVHPILSMKTGEQVGTVELRKDLFGVPVRKDILHRVVVWKLACTRAGTGHAKSRGEMIGRKGKMRAQKGAGRARVGSRFTPSRKGGGTAFPPKPRDFSYTLPKKVRRLALKSALSAKFAQNKLVIVDNFDLETFKTRPFQKMITTRGWDKSCFVGKGEIESNMHFSSRNIPDILVQPQHKANVHDILKKDKLILHSEVLDYFHKRAEGLLPAISKRGARRRKLQKQKAQLKKNAQMMAKERLENLQASEATAV